MMRSALLFFHFLRDQRIHTMLMRRAAAIAVKYFLSTILYTKIAENQHINEIISQLFVYFILVSRKNIFFSGHTLKNLA